VIRLRAEGTGQPYQPLLDSADDIVKLQQYRHCMGSAAAQGFANIDFIK